jgi:hypothetical protein
MTASRNVVVILQLPSRQPYSYLFFCILLEADMLSTGPRKGQATADGGIGLKAEDATNLEARLAVAESERIPVPGHSQRHEKHNKGGTDAQNLLVGQRDPNHNRSKPSPTNARNPFHEIERDAALYRMVVLKMALQRQVFDEPRVQDFTVSPVIGT